MPKFLGVEFVGDGGSKPHFAAGSRRAGGPLGLFAAAVVLVGCGGSDLTGAARVSANNAGGTATRRSPADGSESPVVPDEVTTGRDVSYTPRQAVRDLDSETVRFSAELSTGDSLESVGLSFNESTGEISGTYTGTGTAEIRLTAIDASNARVAVNLTVMDADGDDVAGFPTAAAGAGTDTSSSVAGETEGPAAPPGAEVPVPADDGSSDATPGPSTGDERNASVNVDGDHLDYIFAHGWTHVGGDGLPRRVAQVEVTGRDGIRKGFTDIEEIRFNDISFKIVESPTGDNDLLTGTYDSETISGLDGDDRIVGLGGDDTLFGGAGSDTFEGGFGNDEIHGHSRGAEGPGSDIDTAFYRGNRSDYEITAKVVGDTHWIVVEDDAEGVPTEGRDILYGIERIRFNDEIVMVSELFEPDGDPIDAPADGGTPVDGDINDDNSSPVVVASNMGDLILGVGDLFQMNLNELFADPDGDVLTFGNEGGTPDLTSIGLSVNYETGVIEGTITDAGSVSMNIFAVDPHGAMSGIQSFSIGSGEADVFQGDADNIEEYPMADPADVVNPTRGGTPVVPITPPVGPTRDVDDILDGTDGDDGISDGPGGNVVNGRDRNDYIFADGPSSDELTFAAHDGKGGASEHKPKINTNTKPYVTDQFPKLLEVKGGLEIDEINLTAAFGDNEQDSLIFRGTLVGLGHYGLSLAGLEIREVDGNHFLSGIFSGASVDQNSPTVPIKIIADDGHGGVKGEILHLIPIGEDKVIGLNGAKTAYGTFLKDKFTINANGKTVLGGGGYDEFVVNSGKGNRLFGDAGHDEFVVNSGEGNRFSGGAGHDDFNIKGGHNNSFVGGPGGDTYYVHQIMGPSKNNIRDFSVSDGDRIEFIGFTDLMDVSHITKEQYGSDVRLTMPGFDTEVILRNMVSDNVLPGDDYVLYVP